MAAKQTPTKQSASYRTAVEKNSGSDFDAAFRANLKRNLGGKRSTSKAGPAKPIKKQAQNSEAPYSAHQKHHAQSKALISEPALEKENAERDSPLSDFSGLQSIEELKAEYVAQLKSLREQTGVDVQLPSMEEALRPLTDTNISREDFVHMTQHILSNTSKFKNHRVEMVMRKEETSGVSSPMAAIEPITGPKPSSSWRSGHEQRKNEKTTLLVKNRKSNLRSTTAADEGSDPIALIGVELPSAVAEQSTEDDHSNQSIVSKSSAPTTEEKTKCLLDKTVDDLPSTWLSWQSSVLERLKEAKLSKRELEGIRESLNALWQKCSQSPTSRLYQIFREEADWLANLRANFLGAIIMKQTLGRNGQFQMDMYPLYQQKRRDSGWVLLLKAIFCPNLGAQTWSEDYETLLRGEETVQGSLTTKRNNSEEFRDEEISIEMTFQVLGRQSVLAWKAGAGRTKDWKRGRYAKVATERQISAPRHAKRMRKPPIGCIKVIYPAPDKLWPIVQPKKVSAPLLAVTSHQSRYLKDSRAIIRFFHGFQLSRRESNYCRKPERWRVPGQDSAVQTCMSRGSRKDKEFLEHPVSNIPDHLEAYRYQAEVRQNFIESFHATGDIYLPFKLHRVGDIFCSPYALLQLMAHIRTETHCEVYALRSVDFGLTYEAKIYNMRDIHPKVRKRRVENLKKATDSASFLYSFDFLYRKVCVFLPSEPDTSFAQSKLGAIGRRNTLEYNAAFPPLPKISFRAPITIPRPIEHLTLKKKPALQIVSISGISSNKKVNDDQAFSICVDELLKQEHSRWENYSSPLPLATRLIIRLTELNPSWKAEADSILKCPPPIAKDIAPGHKRSRRGRKNRKVGRGN